MPKMPKTTFRARIWAGWKLLLSGVKGVDDLALKITADLLRKYLSIL
jgi:hypothetical protein